MGRQPKIDWLEVRELYIAGDDNVTQQALADKYGVRQETVARMASKGHWTEDRAAFRHALALKIREKLLTKQASIRARQMRVGQDMQAVGSSALVALVKRMQSGETTLTVDELRRMIVDGTAVESKAAGIPEDGDEETALGALAVALRHCTDDELEQWERTGRLPARVRIDGGDGEVSAE